MGHGILRGLLIGAALCIGLIVAFIGLLGGAGVVAQAKVESRAAELERQMLAKIPADTPPSQRKLMEKQAKQLAKTAAQMDLGSKLIKDRR